MNTADMYIFQAALCKFACIYAQQIWTFLTDLIVPFLRYCVVNLRNCEGAPSVNVFSSYGKRACFAIRMGIVVEIAIPGKQKKHEIEREHQKQFRF